MSHVRIYESENVYWIADKIFNMFTEIKNNTVIFSFLCHFAVELQECLLHFDPESFVFQIAFKNINMAIHRTTVFPVVLCLCETWSLALTVLNSSYCFDVHFL